MESEKSASNKGPLMLSLSLAALLGLGIVAASLWTTRGEAVVRREPPQTSYESSSVAPEPFKLTATHRPRPALRLITTAVADDATRSTATIHVDARGETLVVHPGDVVAIETDPDVVSIMDGGVAQAGVHTTLESVGSGWARFERGVERWTVEITDQALPNKANLKQLVAILSDSSLNPAERVELLLEAKRGLQTRENFMSEASFAPSFDEHDEMNGLYVRSVVYDGVYAQMGLAGGDVLLAVDGIELDSPEASDIALAAFVGSSSLRITRERAGTVENILVQRATKPKRKE